MVADFGETYTVAGESLEMSQQMMPHCDGLCPLEVRVPRHGVRSMVLRLRKEGLHDSLDRLPQLGTGILEEEMHVSGDLIVAATPSVKLGGRGGLIEKSLLQVHVNVLKGSVPIEGAFVDFTQQFVQTRMDGISLLFREQADLGQHSGMGLASSHVEGGEPLIKGDRLAEPLHQVGGTVAETPSPSRLFVVGHEKTIFQTDRPPATLFRMRPEGGDEIKTD